LSFGFLIPKVTLKRQKQKSLPVGRLCYSVDLISQTGKPLLFDKEAKKRKCEKREFYVHALNVWRLGYKVNTLLSLIGQLKSFIRRIEFFYEYLQKIYKSK